MYLNITESHILILFTTFFIVVLIVNGGQSEPPLQQRPRFDLNKLPNEQSDTSSFSGDSNVHSVVPVNEENQHETTLNQAIAEQVDRRTKTRIRMARWRASLTPEKKEEIAQLNAKRERIRYSKLVSYFV